MRGLRQSPRVHEHQARKGSACEYHKGEAGWRRGTAQNRNRAVSAFGSRLTPPASTAQVSNNPRAFPDQHVPVLPRCESSGSVYVSAMLDSVYQHGLLVFKDLVDDPVIATPS